MPGSSASRPSNASAGGQDEQPWLVKSSTTAFAFEGAAGVGSAVASPAQAVIAAIAAQAGTRRLMVPTMQEADPNFRPKAFKNGSQLSDCRAGSKSS